MTIITLGIPAVVVALAPLAHAFMRPVVAKSEPDSKSPNVVSVPVVVSRPRDGFVDVVLLAELAAAAILALGGALLLHGCGAQLTAAQRTDLATETQRCLINERAIVDDPCGALSPDACEVRDRTALATERTRCDAARAAIVGGAR
jgi:hypothetical protein